MTTTELLKTVHTGLNLLLDASPDGCALRNDIGFSGADLRPGTSLARVDWAEWTGPQAALAANIVSRYRNTQLDHLDLPEKVKSSEIIKDVTDRRKVADAKLAEKAESSDYNLKWGEPRKVGTKKGSRIVKSATPTEAFWAAWRGDKEGLKEKGFSVSQWNGDWQVTLWSVPGKKEIATEKKQVISVKSEKLSNPLGLLAYQIPAAERLLGALKSNRAVLDASDTGTGKTYISLGALRELNTQILVLCPKSVIPSWKKAAEHFGIADRLTCLNYEKAKSKTSKVGKWSADKKRFEWVEEAGVIVFDEVHRCKSHKSQNGKLLAAAKRQDILTVCLSATAATNPLEMKSLGYALGLHDYKGFWNWTEKYNCRPSRWGGYEFNGGPATLNRLHSTIFPERGSRVRVADLGDAFPDTLLTTELCPHSEKKALKDSLKELDEYDAATLEDPTEAGTHHLTLRLRARQLSEKGKIDALAEQADDYVNEGNSVAIFVNFKDTIDSLVEKLSKKHAVEIIDGRQNAEERQEAIERFQADKSRIIICNIKAGGVGVSLHDLHGNHPRVALISPTDSAQDLKQTFGRVHRAGGKTKSIQRILFAEGVEEEVAANVAAKLECLDQLNDGDLALPTQAESVTLQQAA